MIVRTQIPGNWENPTQAIVLALRGEIPVLPEMITFCRESALDADAYGDYKLAEENRQDAARLKEIEENQ